MVTASEVERMRRIEDDISRAGYVLSMSDVGEDHKQKIANELQHAMLLLNQLIRNANKTEE
jgi:hypothetical protein